MKYFVSIDLNHHPAQSESYPHPFAIMYSFEGWFSSRFLDISSPVRCRSKLDSSVEDEFFSGADISFPCIPSPVTDSLKLFCYCTFFALDREI